MLSLKRDVSAATELALPMQRSSQLKTTAHSLQKTVLLFREIPIRLDCINGSLEKGVH